MLLLGSLSHISRNNIKIQSKLEILRTQSGEIQSIECTGRSRRGI